ncbi:MAG: hypothetical protein LBH05_01590 [Deferribacteraceae bacterium]|jgi:hypothetical protein|nr:hypothetical protein [Deferribacteraceae bacterium]
MTMSKEDYEKMMEFLMKYCSFTDHTHDELEIVSYPKTDEEVEKLGQLVEFYNRTHK